MQLSYLHSRLKIICLLVIFIPSILFAQPATNVDQDQTLNSLLDQARLSKWTEDYKRAVINFEKVLEIDPDNKEAIESLEEIGTLTSPKFEYKATLYEDEEDFSRHAYGTFSSFYLKYATLVKLGYVYSRFSQNSRSLYKNAYSLDLKHRASPKLTLGAGYTFNDYQGKIEDDFAYKADLYYQALENTGLYFSFSHLRIIDSFEPFPAYGYNIVNDIDAVLGGIKTYDYKVALVQKINQKLSWLSSFTFGDYSDSNEKIDIFTELDYKLLDKPDVHLKYGYYALNFSESSSQYWSPDHYDVHSLSIEAGDNLSEKIRLVNEASLSYLVDVEDVGYAFISRIIYSLNQDWDISLSGFYARSGREDDNDFWSTNFTLSIIGRF